MERLANISEYRDYMKIYTSSMYYLNIIYDTKEDYV